MSTTVQTINTIKSTTDAELAALIGRRDSITDDEFTSEFSKLQIDGLWSALIELAARLDAAPEVASRKINQDIRNAFAG